nr:thioredoxin domain-containing protein [Streptomyces sp. SID5468]
MRAEREREKIKAKRKRTALVAGGIVAVLAAAAGIGIAVSGSGGSGAGGAAGAPSGALGKSDLAVPVGRSGAPSTLTVYEDFRCPACDVFEKTFRDTVHGLQDGGQLQSQYHLVTLIDSNLRGSGSLRAGNAAACAQDQGKFRAYHDVLYDNQPDERDDRFADNNYLLQLADKVPGLRTAAFTSCVRDGRYDGWIKKSNSDFNNSGYNSTPTVLLNGKSIYGPNTPLTPDGLKKMVADANRGKAPAPASGSPASSAPASRASSGSSAPAPGGPGRSVSATVTHGSGTPGGGRPRP